MGSSRAFPAREQSYSQMDNNSSAVWAEVLSKEEKAHKQWLKKQNRDPYDSPEEDPDVTAEYERALKKMPMQQRVSLRSIQLRRGGLSKKIGSWADKEVNPPRTPSQDVEMIRDKLPPIGPVISGDLDGYNAHTHLPGYTGFFPGRKCKEYLLLKRADPDTNAQLE